MRFLFVWPCLLLILLISAPQAEAHARLVRSEPAKAAELSPAPKRVELWFNELLENGFNTVTVYLASELGAATHSEFVEGKPAVDGKDKTHLSVGLKPLPPGEYVLEWRVLSRDGHSAPGRLTFRVK